LHVSPCASSSNNQILPFTTIFELSLLLHHEVMVCAGNEPLIWCSRPFFLFFFLLIFVFVLLKFQNNSSICFSFNFGPCFLPLFFYIKQFIKFNFFQLHLPLIFFICQTRFVLFLLLFILFEIIFKTRLLFFAISSSFIFFPIKLYPHSFYC
jgi:hypothetical protein